MDTDILDRALDNCDLGDGYKALVRKYPHKDMIPQLTKCREVVPIDWEKIALHLDMNGTLATNVFIIQQLVEKQLEGEE